MNKVRTLMQFWKLCGTWQTIKLCFTRLLRGKEISITTPLFEKKVVLRMNNSDLVIFLGTFLHGDSWLENRFEPKTILDLGANIGITALQFIRQFPQATIIAVEPNDDSFRVLQHNIGGQNNIRAVKKVIQSQKGYCKIDNPSDLAMAFRFEKANSTEGEVIEGTTVEALLEEARAEPPVLVKMDIEGAERDIFLSQCGWMKEVDAILVEPHGPGTGNIVTKKLKNNGYIVEQIGEKIFGSKHK
jgi:FkbM family methyltransferase